MRSGEVPTNSELVADGVAAQQMPVWPMTLGIVIAAWVLDFLVSWLPRGSMNRIGLVVLASMLLFSAVIVCGLVVRTVYGRLLPSGKAVATPVVRAACLTALWVPAWVLFVETSSLLMIAASILCLLTLGYFMKRCQIERVQAEVEARQHQPGTPFLFEGTPLTRVLLPSLLLVLLLDAAIALAANYWFVASSLMAGVFAGVLAWRAATRRIVIAGASPVVQPKPVVSSSGQAGIAAAAFVLTLAALLPFLRAGQKTYSMKGPKVAKNAADAPKDPSASADGYSGIILLPLAEAQKKIVAPVKRDLVPHFGVKISEPMEIPFDGQYWYFKPPEKQPRPTAKVVRGSSTKAQIRSTDRYPLLMEAHQKLSEPIDLGCCSAMNLVVENADKLEGAIALELWVKKLPDAKAAAKQRVNVVAPELAPHYLGTMVIPTSEMPIAARPNVSGKLVEEKLSFPIPAAMDGTMFDEITVVVRPAPERAKAGAQIAIRKFVLEP
ncbi:MAG: hypothetical protein JSS95_10360 [Acidobacteria bacterium]|nr:hypothetical protein [Acidobacteriota bacterium]